MVLGIKEKILKNKNEPMTSVKENKKKLRECFTYIKQDALGMKKKEFKRKLQKNEENLNKKRMKRKQ